MSTFFRSKLRFVVLIFFMVFVSGLIFFMSGCTAESEEAKIQQESSRLTSGLTAGFISTMDIQYRDIRATATIDQQYPGNYKISFTEPSALNGMEVETQGDIIKIKYRELSSKFTADEFFDSSVASMVVSSINAATSQEGLNVTLEDRCLTIAGMGNSGSGVLQGNGTFILKIDRKNGNLMQLELPDKDLKVNFKDFKFLS